MKEDQRVWVATIICSLVSICGHGAYTQVKRRVWAVPLYCVRTYTCTVVAMGVHCAYTVLRSHCISTMC